MQWEEESHEHTWGGEVHLSAKVVTRHPKTNRKVTVCRIASNTTLPYGLKKFNLRLILAAPQLYKAARRYRDGDPEGLGDLIEIVNNIEAQS